MTAFNPDLTVDERESRLNKLALRALNLRGDLARAADSTKHKEMLMAEMHGQVSGLRELFAPDDAELQKQIQATASMVSMSYQKCDDAMLSTPVIVETFNELFTEGGMFVEYAANAAPPNLNPDSAKLTAALYYLVLSNPGVYGSWRDSVFLEASMALLRGGDALENFVAALNELHGPGCVGSYLDLLPEVTLEALDGAVGKIPHRIIYAGGVEALDRAGADLVKVLAELEQTVIDCPRYMDFSAIYTLSKQILGSLCDAEICDEDFRYAAEERLRKQVIIQLGRDTVRSDKARAFWAEALNDIAPYIDFASLTTKETLLVAKYASDDNAAFDSHPAKYISHAKLIDWKKELRETFALEEQYPIIQKLRMEPLYKEDELFRVMGNKFARELGI